MATISYTTESDLDAGWIKVQWEGLAPGDDGQPFDCTGLALASIHYWGDFDSNAGLVLLYASNEQSPSPANYGEMIYSNAPRMQTLPDPRLAFFGSVLPKADANMIDGNVCILFVTRDRA